MVMSRSCQHVNCLVSNEVHIMREAFGHEDLTNDEVAEYIEVSGEELMRHICVDVCPFRFICEISKDLADGTYYKTRGTENRES